MKRAGYIIILGLIAAAVGYACTDLAGMKAQYYIEKSNQPALAWLQEEYHLNNTQFIRECQLQAAYQPKCTEMCQEIDAMNARLQNLIAATNTITPEIKQALAENAQLRADCEQMMLAHFYSVAQAMPPEQGKRYLAWVQKETLIPAPMSAKTHFINSMTTKPD
jgi:hypothetical protein